ncbi:hypothetical protein PIB30_107585, partial [Stylosanthes scabra]|nr:hypothetical protein [Stylosanthes scabra]
RRKRRRRSGGGGEEEAVLAPEKKREAITVEDEEQRHRERQSAVRNRQIEEDASSILEAEARTGSRRSTGGCFVGDRSSIGRRQFGWN